MGWGVLVSYDYTPREPGNVDYYYLACYCNTGDEAFGPIIWVPYPRTDGKHLDVPRIKNEFYHAWMAACKEMHGGERDPRSMDNRTLRATLWLMSVHAGWRERKEFYEIFEDMAEQLGWPQ